MNVLRLLPRGGRWLGGLVVAAFLTAPACDPTESFSEVPEIAPLRVTQKDSVETGRVELSQVDVVISWKDGNGDLGYIEGEANPELNYFLTIEKKKGGVFKEIVPPTVAGATGYSGHFVNLNPEGKKSTKAFKLRGELTYRLASPGFQVLPATYIIGTIDGVNETIRAGDVLRFQVQIKDRAGNLSNRITTDEVTL